MSVQCICGIDPGLSGAVAFYWPSEPHIIIAEDVPIVACAIDAVSLSQRIEQMRPNLAVLERVGAMPGQGVSSMFKFGQAFGTVQGILAAIKVPTHLVATVTWKRHFRLPADKELSRGLALRTWPASDRFGRKKDHGRAEASLVALF